MLFNLTQFQEQLISNKYYENKVFKILLKLSGAVLYFSDTLNNKNKFEF